MIPTSEGLLRDLHGIDALITALDADKSVGWDGDDLAWLRDQRQQKAILLAGRPTHLDDRVVSFDLWRTSDGHAPSRNPLSHFPAMAAECDGARTATVSIKAPNALESANLSQRRVFCFNQTLDGLATASAAHATRRQGYDDG